jgi:excinuclease UvrABC helicase subunit UvrB
MKNKSRISFELSIDAASTNELIYALESIKNRMANGNAQIPRGRFKLNGAIIDFKFDYYGENYFRVESINGTLCQIYKSKMDEIK